MNGLQKASSISIIILAVIAVLAAALLARPVLFPVVLALVMAAALKPVARLICDKLGLHTIVASVLVVLTLLATVSVGIFALSGPASEWMSSAPTKFEEVERKLRPVKETVEDLSDAADHLDDITDTAKDPDKVTVEVSRPTLTSAVLSATAEAGLEFAIAISCLFLFLAFGDDFVNRLGNLAWFRHKRKDFVNLVRDAEGVISIYLLKFTLINIALGILIGLGMWGDRHA